jgi:hypothetical protein
MKNFGKNVNIKSKNQPNLSEKDIFIKVVGLLDQCWERTNGLGEDFNMDMSTYDEPFYLVIENLFYVKYGEWKTDVILWWVYNRFNEEGELMPIKLNDHVEKTEEEIIVETPEELWNFLKRIEKIKKDK